LQSNSKLAPATKPLPGQNNPRDENKAVAKTRASAAFSKAQPRPSKKPKKWSDYADDSLSDSDCEELDRDHAPLVAESLSLRGVADGGSSLAGEVGQSERELEEVRVTVS
jgi:hypothetical protein